MNYPKKVVIIIGVFVLFLLSQKPTFAATFTLDPATQTFAPNASVGITLRIDTQGQDVTSADALVQLDPTYFEFLGIENGQFFPNTLSTISPDNRVVRIGGTIDPNTSPKQGAGVFAVMNLKAKTSGNSTISFVCGTTGSKIMTPTVQDILACSSLQNGTYTISGSGGNPGGGNPGGGNPGGGGSNPPTGPYYTPVPGTPTCDACGKCGNSPEPPNYGACKQCVAGGSSWTAVGCVPTNAAGFVQSILRFIIPLGTGLAFLGLLGGGFMLATSSGDPVRIARGKSFLFGSIGALLIVVFAVFILNFVGVNLLGLPGF